MAGGGGATDIRLNSSLYSRIIVAAGGGSDGKSEYGGGYGGSTQGGSSTTGCGNGGLGATQTAGGSLRGTFGVGGSGNQWSSGYGGAGGGGWYGGGGTDPDGSVDDDKGGGGGSSFVYIPGVTVPTNYSVEERFLLKDTTLRSGIDKIPTYDGLSEMQGNIGDGYAKITFVKNILHYPSFQYPSFQYPSFDNT